MAKNKRPRPKLVTLHQAWRGRNTKCTPELIERLCGYLREGLPIVHACALVGISDVTYRNWIHQGQAYLQSGDIPQHEILGEFLLALKRAFAEWQLGILREELNGPQYRPGWAKSMTMLERRDRSHWGRDQYVSNDADRMSPDESFL